jgi:hypothetical protein
MTRLYNWTWASIVGYPFYYVSNTISLKDQQNGWGIYGMNRTGPAGLNAFLQGLDNRIFSSDPTDIKSEVGVVSLSGQVLESCNYYGIYPYPNQTSTRALKSSTLSSYNLYPALQIFNTVNMGGTIYNPGALYNHKSGTQIEGSFLALGLTRTPDIRLTVIGLLSYYKPRLYRSEYTATNATRLVVLQLGQVGGV